MNLSIPVKEIMSTNLITVTPTSSLTDVRDIFNKHRMHHIPVVLGREMVGIISRIDLLAVSHGKSDSPEATAKNNEIYAGLTAADIMTNKIAKLSPDSKVDVAAKVFLEDLFHAIPVVENGELKGIVTTYDIIKYVFELDFPNLKK